MIQVTHFMRRAHPRAFSMERLFEDIRAALPSDIKVRSISNRFYSKGFIKRLYDAVRAAFNQGDVNHVTGDTHYLTYFLQRHRTLLTVHDCVPLHRARGIKFWLLWFFWYWLPEKRCIMITVVSEATRKQLLSYLRCNPEKIRVIHNNVSKEFNLSYKKFKKECPRILHVGTKINKNIERHTAALEGLSCTLVVIGRLSDQQKGMLEEYGVQYESYNNLSRQELVEQYHKCDLLLFASTYEGFGLPIVEAQACGRPVVTSNILSMPEVAGQAACLVDPFSVQSIRDGVRRVIENEQYRERLIQSGLKNVRRFSADEIAKQYAFLYREILEKRY